MVAQELGSGVFASLAATEAMVHLTGLRTPQNQLTTEPTTAASGLTSTHRAGRHARTAHDGAVPDLVLARAYENELCAGEGEPLPQTGLSGESDRIGDGSTPGE